MSQSIIETGATVLYMGHHHSEYVLLANVTKVLKNGNVRIDHDPTAQFRLDHDKKSGQSTGGTWTHARITLYEGEAKEQFLARKARLAIAKARGEIIDQLVSDLNSISDMETLAKIKDYVAKVKTIAEDPA